MLDHVGFPVSDIGRAKAFYGASLAPLGYRVHLETHGWVGFGAERPDFWIGPGEPTRAIHVCFTAPDRKTVDAFHRAALAAGGRDNGAPGLRPHYHPSYYGAFALDPDGNNVEAVCHRQE
jgi:catechol 2,3-dioxygenase-like lactoylglutathione lyase family enzyme